MMMKKQPKVKIYFKLLLILLLGAFLSSCDFSSGLNRSILEAENFIKEGKHSRAILVYEGILESKPSEILSVKIRYQLSQLYKLYQREYLKSIRHLKTALAENKDPIWQVKILESIGLIYFENLRDYSNSEKYYKYLIDYRPILNKHEEYLFFYAKCLFEQRKYFKAGEIFDSIIEMQVMDKIAESYHHKALMHYYREEWSKAVNIWYQALRYEKRKSVITQIKYLMANSFESNEELKNAYNMYYSILDDFPYAKVIKSRLENLYNRRIARKR